MHPTRLLGVVALVVGSVLFLDEFCSGDDVLRQTTGFTWASLRPRYGLLFVLGLPALWVEAQTTSDSRNCLKRSTEL